MRLEQHAQRFRHLARVERHAEIQPELGAGFDEQEHQRELSRAEIAPYVSATLVGANALCQLLDELSRQAILALSNRRGTPRGRDELSRANCARHRQELRFDRLRNGSEQVVNGRVGVPEKLSEHVASPLLHGGDDELVTIAEVHVKRAARAARSLTDGVEARTLDAVLGKAGDGGVDQRRARAFLRALAQ